MKSKLDKQIERSRKEAAPKRHARVEYPIQLPPIGHVEEGKTTVERALPNEDTDWRAAKVVKVEHQKHRDRPDHYAAVLRPLNDKGKPFGPEIALSVIYLREAS